MSQSTVADLDVDLRQLFSSLARNWRRIVAVALAVTALAFMAAWMATPHYRAETRLLIETRESVFTRPNAGVDSDRPILDEEGVTSQVELISSTDILKQVAQKFNLSRLPEFDETAGMSSIGRLLVIAGLKSDPNEISPEERVLKRMRENLNVYRIDKSRVIVIEFSSQDPKLAAEIPNAIADAYISVLGEERALSSYPLKTWKDLGFKPATGSDSPVCHPNPFPNIYSMLTRKTVKGTVMDARECATIEEALQVYTEHGAFSQKLEKVKGRLVPGQMADIAVFSRNMLTASPEEILHDTRCDLTIRGGEIVFERGS